MRTRTDEARLGDVLLRMGAVTERELADAVQKQRSGDSRPLGVLLVELGYADAGDVQLALLRQHALRGQLPHDDGLRLLEEAREEARKACTSLSELARAAEELGRNHHG
jgi:hypothetical protein